ALQAVDSLELDGDIFAANAKRRADATQVASKAQAVGVLRPPAIDVIRATQLAHRTDDEKATAQWRWLEASCSRVDLIGSWPTCCSSRWPAFCCSSSAGSQAPRASSRPSWVTGCPGSKSRLREGPSGRSGIHGFLRSVPAERSCAIPGPACHAVWSARPGCAPAPGVHRFRQRPPG